MKQPLRHGWRWRRSKGRRPSPRIASEYGVHPNQVRQWKEHLLDVLPGIFSDRRKKTEEERDELEAELYQQIGQLKVENDWLKKNFSSFSRGEEAIGGKG